VEDNMTSLMMIKKIISKHLRKHDKEKDRYMSEVVRCQKGRLTKAKEIQMSYSYQKANTELAISDVLEEILREVK
jgi:hypothetical protein